MTCRWHQRWWAAVTGWTQHRTKTKVEPFGLSLWSERKTTQGKAPQYLVNCCHPTSDVASRQWLRSSCRHHLVVPRHRRSMLGHRAFSVAGPMAWNALPEDLRGGAWEGWGPAQSPPRFTKCNSPPLSADNFRKTLKTHLFRNALGHLGH